MFSSSTKLTSKILVTVAICLAMYFGLFAINSNVFGQACIPGYCVAPCCTTGNHCTSYCMGSTCMGSCVADINNPAVTNTPVPTAVPPSVCKCSAGQYCYGYCIAGLCTDCRVNSAPTATTAPVQTGSCGNGIAEQGETCCQYGQDMSTCCVADLGYCRNSVAANQYCGSSTCQAGTDFPGRPYDVFCFPDCNSVPRSCTTSNTCNAPTACTSDASCAGTPQCGIVGNPNCGAVKCHIAGGDCYSDCSTCYDTGPAGSTPVPTASCGSPSCGACNQNGIKSCHDNCGTWNTACTVVINGPWSVGGLVFDGATPVAGARMEIHDTNLNASTYVMTEANGSYFAPSFVQAGHAYSVRVNTDPTGYNGAKTSTGSYVYSTCNDGGSGHGDMPLGSTAYNCQTAGTFDCAGANNNYMSNRCNFMYPSPTLYPTIMITGTLKENPGSGGSCAAPISMNAASFGFSLSPNIANVTTTCSTTQSGNTASAYACSVQFNNQVDRFIATTAQLSVVTTGTNYSSINVVNSNACVNTGGNAITVTTADTTINKDILFSVGAWYKVRRANIHKYGDLNNAPPVTWDVFDADDFNLATGYGQYINEGNTGVVTTSGNVNVGTAWGVKQDAISSRKWLAETYTHSIDYDPTTFLQYVQARKAFSTAATVNDINAKNKIWVLNSGSVTVDNTIFTRTGMSSTSDALVVFVQGDLTIAENIFNSNLYPVAFVVTGSINFTKDSTIANGVFIANHVTIDDRNPADDSGFKISGNLVSQTAFSQNRIRTNSAKPSFFLYFLPQMYNQLLPYLSVATYDWKQSQ